MRYDDPVIIGLVADRINEELFMLPTDFLEEATQPKCAKRILFENDAL